MDNNEFEYRKNARRQHLKSKNLDKSQKFVDHKDEYKLKKRFKKNKEQLIAEELWQEWQDETD